MTHLISGKRYLAVYLKDAKLALTLVIQDMKAGWVAQLLDNRPPNEAKPLLLCYEIVSDPKEGKAVLEQELNEFLEAENWPKTALLWDESEHVDVGATQLDE
ncbi:MAG TPA: hypothetical protein VN939_20280 [Chthoniobacterales bacterium]|jgi:hypothetical protein|nr:hypothetical protein [Chthoniobacterales bacterium]